METQMAKKEDKLTKRFEDIAGAKTDEERKKARNKFKQEAEVAAYNAKTDAEVQAVEDVEKQRREMTQQIVEAAKNVLDPEVRCLLIDASPESYNLGPEYVLRAIITNSREASKRRMVNAIKAHEAETRRKIGPLHSKREELQRRSGKEIEKAVKELESQRTAELREAEQAVNTKYNKLIADAHRLGHDALTEVHAQISVLTQAHERFILDREFERDVEYDAFDRLISMIDKAHAQGAS